MSVAFLQSFANPIGIFQCNKGLGWSQNFDLCGAGSGIIGYGLESFGPN